MFSFAERGVYYISATQSKYRNGNLGGLDSLGVMPKTTIQIKGPYAILSRLGNEESLYLPTLTFTILIDAYNRLQKLQPPDPRLKEDGAHGYMELKNPDK